MRDYAPKEKARITAGAVASLVIVGWLVMLAIAFLTEIFESADISQTIAELRRNAHQSRPT